MASRLNALNDRQDREHLLRPPEIDVEHHRMLADQIGGKNTWKEKLELAIKGPAQLIEAEFHYFELYKPGITKTDIDAYVGRARQKELYKICNSPYWLAVSEDKAIFELILKGANLPVATTVAIFSDVPRFGFAHELRSREDIYEFLTNQSFPIFCKPLDGMFGIGAMRIDGLAGDRVELVGPATEEFSDFYEYISRLSSSGFLFQRCIEQAQSITDLFGPAVCTIRFLALNSSSPIIEAAMIRTAGGSSTLDHRLQGGGVLAAIDVNSGRISNAVLLENGLYKPIRTNPNTGHEVDGAILEHWQDACKLVLRAATLFPLVRTQSWDIAISKDGPIVMEFNWGGNLSGVQLVQRRGVLSPSFKDHLEVCMRNPIYVHPIH
jgi:Sugar-transfer associated ATP-grasp